MDLLERHIVDAGFRLAKRTKNGGGSLPHAGVEARLVQDFENLGQAAMRLPVVTRHARECRRHPVLPDLLRENFPAGNLQARKLVAQALHRHAGIDQRAECHVSADVRKAVKISNFHRIFPLQGIVSAELRSVKPRPFALPAETAKTGPRDGNPWSTAVSGPLKALSK